MRILLTNDDGIRSDGLWRLHEQLAAKHKVSVIAPKDEQSGIAHAFTLHTPLRIEKTRIAPKQQGWAVQGTPADCVKIGVTTVMKQKPDLVVSGINPGDNAGISHYYSGTVGAAREAALLGIPSIAISVSLINDEQFRAAARFVDTLIGKVRSLPGKENFLLNVNFPPVPPAQIKGVKITRQGCAMFEDQYQERTDTRGGHYYWILGGKATHAFTPDSDDQAMRQGYIAITPLRVDATHDAARDFLIKHLDTDFTPRANRSRRAK